MNEILTFAEMHDRYPSEWLLIEDPETDENLEIIRGKVVFHSPDRNAMYARAKELQLHDSAFVYTGEIPKEPALIISVFGPTLDLISNNGNS